MNKTLRISFSLRNTYRVNGILYSLKQIPLLKKILPEALYRLRGLKIFANLLSGIWEIISVFLGKFLYFLFMVAGAGLLYRGIPRNRVYLHILLCLTVIGSFMNTNLFNPTRDKYYAMILLRMDAREYTIVNYLYSILKVIIGFLPFSLWFGRSAGIPLWICLMIPFSVAGVKMAVAASSLWDYEKRGLVYNENRLYKALWLFVGIMLAAAYGLPAVGIVLPQNAAAAIMALFIPAGAAGLWKILRFQNYREINQQLLGQITNQMDTVTQAVVRQNRKTISTDTRITSKRKGFEYLNELFIKRHRKILWSSSEKIAAVCLFLIVGMLLAFYLQPTVKEATNKLLMVFLPYFVFIMYCINRGTGFTRALFINCDRSLLTYSFYKKPDMVLKLFRIRLREIVKINLLPAAVIGGGLAILLYASGGTDNPVNYAVLFVSVLCMSIFFSIHYLTIYYLLQPYNAGTEMKSGTYRIVLSGTYLVCFWMMQLRMPTLVFGVICIVFCVVYSVVACALVYRFAPKTFRLRN
ncbi:MAG TPA: hypothetical protein IAA05_10165 [Candidatus Blautia excrementipullorum]|nr:hypothetical protein [Candidatus Blautia excrementipullorum]